MRFTTPLLILGAAFCSAQDIPVTGAAADSLRAFDDAMLAVMGRNQTEGGVLAVMRGGRLVLARGYGWADKAVGREMEPESLIRIASVSKVLTMLALDALVKEDKIRLDAKVFDTYLKGYLPESGGDVRYLDIKVGHLASHTAGLTTDPRCDAAGAVGTVDAPEPPTSEHMARHVVRVIRLKAAPPAAYEYSNVGYMLLGRAMEHASGEALEGLVRRTVFEPQGLSRPRFGHTRGEDFSTLETTYADVPRARKVPSVFPGTTRPQPIAQGGCPFEAQEALGGWTASVIDLALLMARTEGPTVDLLANGSFNIRRSNAYAFYGAHVEGNITVIRRFGNGDAIAASLNSSNNVVERAASVNDELDRALQAARNSIAQWPEDDLYPDYQRNWAEKFPAIVDPEPLVFQTGEGEAAPARVSLHIDGPEGLPFRITSHALWLGLSAQSGTLPADVEVWAQPNGMLAGSYPDELMIEHGAEFANPIVKPVKLILDARASRPRTLRIRPAGLSPLAVGDQIDLSLAAVGGTAPFSWSVISGKVPVGVELDKSTGRIRGKVTEQALYEWTVRVTDARGWTADRGLSAAVGVPGFVTAQATAFYSAADTIQTCSALPKETTGFQRTDARVVAILIFEGSLAIGDQAVFEWVSPDGTVRQRNVFTSSSSWGAGWGAGCLNYVLDPRTQGAAPSGQWSIRLFWNRNPAGETKFSLQGVAPVPGIILASGQPSSFTYAARNSPTLYFGANGYGYRIVVPPGSTQLQVRVNDPSKIGVFQLFLRFDSDVGFLANRPVADYESIMGSDVGVLLASDTLPRLRWGTYYIAVGVTTTGKEVSGTITATVTTGPATVTGNCRYSVSPATISISSLGGSGNFYVATSANGCPWTAASNSSWLTVTPSSGNDSLNVGFLAPFNDTGNPRTAQVTIAGQTVIVTQAETTNPGLAVVNSGFENPLFPDYPNYGYNPTGSGVGWTFSPIAGRSGSGIASNNSAFVDNTIPSAYSHLSNAKAPDGVQVGFIQGTGRITQTIEGFKAGVAFIVSFSMAQRVNYDRGLQQSLDVVLDGTKILGTFSFPLMDPAYHSVATVPFETTEGPHTLTFVGKANGDATALIDNIQVLPKDRAN